jgi:glucose-6-phosphate 1-dehydrogenase
VETAWGIVDSIRKAWDGNPLTNREFYAAGTWGPVAANDLLAASHHVWREPQFVANGGDNHPGVTHPKPQ